MMERQPRLIVSTEGSEGSGKTRLALTAPRPLWWLDFDFGLEGVEGSDRVDERRTYDLMAAEWMPDAMAARHAQEVMRRFITDYREAVGKARTLVVDTFSAAWSGQRLARPEDKYDDIRTEFASLVRLAYAGSQTNVILIHHLKPDWKRNTAGKSYPAGTWSRDGMDGVANMVQLAIRQRFVPPQFAGQVKTAEGRFEIDVLKCRDNVGLVGTTLPGMDFATLGAMIAPTIDWSK